MTQPVPNPHEFERRRAPTRRAVVAALAVVTLALPGAARAAQLTVEPSAVRLLPFAAPPKTKSPPKLRRVAVVSPSANVGALLPELRLRRPDLTLVDAERRGAATLAIGEHPTHVELELRTADARVYKRRVPADRELGPRALAADSAAFLSAVERGDIAAEPESSAKAGRSKEQRNSNFADAFQLGGDVGPSATLPIGGRQSVAAGAFIAATVVARAELVRRVVLELSARVGGKRALGHRLVRGRIGFGAGYRFTRDIFDMPLTGALTIEPWSIKPRGDAEPLRADAVNLARPPSLIGVALRAAPAALLPLSNGVTVRIGGSVELATSAAPGAGGGAVRANSGDRAPTALRVGGFEATVAAQIGVWVPYSRIRSKKRRSR